MRLSINLRYKRLFQEYTDQGDDARREQQRPPIANPQMFQQQPGDKRPSSIDSPMGKVDDVQQSEDQCQTQAEDRIESPIDQT